MSETTIQREIMKAVSATGARIFRNNTAMGWVGHRNEVRDSASGLFVTIRNPRPLHAGLCVGSSDLIGWTANGRFLAIEVKTATGRITEDQENFIAAVIRAGGVAGVVRSVEDALTLLEGK